MASKVYNEAKKLAMTTGLGLTGDIRAIICMTNTTADTENDGINNIDDFTTLDEHNGTNYARKAFTSETVTEDDTNDRSEFTADNVTWTALGAGTRSVAGIIIYKHVTADSDHVPYFWIEFSASPDGNDFVVRWNSGSSSGAIARAA